jgi:queuine tRNA-ribosyltransferase
MTRVALLLAGFHAGVGHATGLKEETTMAANTPALVEEPLGASWLERVQRSGGAEPLFEAVYRQAALSPESWAGLMAHPQFQKT